MHVPSSTGCANICSTGTGATPTIRSLQTLKLHSVVPTLERVLAGRGGQRGGLVRQQQRPSSSSAPPTPRRRVRQQSPTRGRRHRRRALALEPLAGLPHEQMVVVVAQSFAFVAFEPTRKHVFGADFGSLLRIQTLLLHTNTHHGGARKKQNKTITLHIFTLRNQKCDCSATTRHGFRHCWMCVCVCVVKKKVMGRNAHAQPSTIAWGHG